MLRSLLAAALLAVLVPTAALAARTPTRAERAVLIAATWRVIGHRPAGCVHFRIRVSDDGLYAEVDPLFTGSSYAYGKRCQPGNGFVVFARARHGWQKLYEGSEPPVCYQDSRYPAGMIKLIGCLEIPPGQP